jgi:hypothetical protein
MHRDIISDKSNSQMGLSISFVCDVLFVLQNVFENGSFNNSILCYEEQK